MRVSVGMKVRLSGEFDDEQPWIVLDRHPDKGYWWLHRWTAGTWETSSARHHIMRQVFK